MEVFSAACVGLLLLAGPHAQIDRANLLSRPTSRKKKKSAGIYCEVLGEQFCLLLFTTY